MYKPSTPDEWYAEAGVFSRALRGLADRWDAALTNGADGGELQVIVGEIADLPFEMDTALVQYGLVTDGDVAS